MPTDPRFCPLISLNFPKVPLFPHEIYIPLFLFFEAEIRVDLQAISALLPYIISPSTFFPLSRYPSHFFPLLFFPFFEHEILAELQAVGAFLGFPSFLSCPSVAALFLLLLSPLSLSFFFKHRVCYFYEQILPP